MDVIGNEIFLQAVRHTGRVAHGAQRTQARETTPLFLYQLPGIFLFGIVTLHAAEPGIDPGKPSILWRREFQNKSGANSKTTEYAANIQKADLEEALPGPLSYVLSSIPSRCAAALAIVMCASIPTASKPSSAAAASVVPLPAKGSRILPPGTHICTT